MPVTASDTLLAGAGGFTAAQLARAALRRLLAEGLEPTPENYARAYQHQLGDAAGASILPAAAQRLVEIVAALALGGDASPGARRFGEAMARGSWDEAERALEAGTGGPIDSGRSGLDADEAQAWQQVARVLGTTLRQALPAGDGGSKGNTELADALQALAQRIAADGAQPALVSELERLCQRAARVLLQQHRLFGQLGALCRELTESLGELAEDDSWVRGQCEAMRSQLEDGLTTHGVHAINGMLRDTRSRHGELRRERARARDALKLLINRMLSELGELGVQTGQFQDSVGRYATVIEGAETLESLTGAVREMVEESRAVQSLVQQTRQRLHDEHAKASDLSERVSQLEGEMRRLADEVSTDQLTSIANRRGLLRAFEIERARLQRHGGELAIGMLDIDNFKRLNDELGHGAGDEALRSLADRVRRALRPTDCVARYGGEEFAVLLPHTGVHEAEQVLTRLQRSLTGGLFLHKETPVFVTFSAGVTDYRADEAIDEAIERADQALYEAKRLGKNRTCIG
jgi:diguanylate cyclase